MDDKEKNEIKKMIREEMRKGIISFLGFILEVVEGDEELDDEEEEGDSQSFNDEAHLTGYL